MVNCSLFTVHRKSDGSQSTVNRPPSTVHRLGFTLIELLLAAVILGIISTVGIRTFGNTQDRGRDARRKEDIKTIRTALTAYYFDHKTYPPSAGTGTEGYLASDSGTDPWITDLGPYFSNSIVPKDPKQAQIITGLAGIIKKTPEKLKGLIASLIGTQKSTEPKQKGEVAGLATIAFDSSSAPPANSGTGMSWNHTVGAGSNRILVVGFSNYTNGSTSIGTVTYAGLPLTKLGSKLDSFDGTNTAEIWYLLNPPSGTNIIAMNKINYSGTLNAVVAGATSWANVNQITPFGTYSSANGISANPSLSIPSSTGDKVIDVIASHGSTTPTPGAGQTAHWRTFYSSMTEAGGGSSKDGIATTTTMSWTLSATWSWAYLGVALKPAQAPSPTPTPISTPTPTPPPSTSIWCEVENASMTAPMTIVSGDASASNGKYIYSQVTDTATNPPPPPSTTGLANLTFNVPQAGTYTFWLRVYYPDDGVTVFGGASNSAWGNFDDGATWFKIGNETTPPSATPYNEWHWINFANGDTTPITMTATFSTVGNHNLKIYGRESNMRIDKILLTTDSTLTPTSTGSADNCGSPAVADIKANGSGGPVSITSGNSATLTWTSANATSCSVTPQTAPGTWTGLTSPGQTTGPLTTNTLYTINCNGPNGPGSDTVQINVTPVSPPPACSPATQSVRVGNSARLDASGGNGIYSWTATGGTPSSGSGNPFSVTYSAVGTYNVTVTSDGQTSLACTVTVTNPPSTPPSCTPSSQPTGINVSVNLMASGGNGIYSWSAPGGNPSSGSGTQFSVSYSAVGTYSVTVTSDGQTSPPCTVTVTGPPAVNNCLGKTFTYCYWVSADRNSFVLWAQLDNQNDSEIYSKPTAPCQGLTPPDTNFNFCAKSPN